MAGARLLHRIGAPGDDVERRFFLAESGLALAALVNQWLLDTIDRVLDSLDGKRIGHATVDDIEAITAAVDRVLQIGDRPTAKITP